MTEEVNDSCKEKHKRYEKHMDDMINPQSGVIKCMNDKREQSAIRMHKRIDEVAASKVGLKIFLSLIGAFVLISGASFSYTGAVQKESNVKYATKDYVKESDDKLEKQIDKLEKKMDANTATILRAIGELKQGYNEKYN